MSYQSVQGEELRDRFVYLASELSSRFPQLDLRFNWQAGSEVLRLVLPNSSKRRVIELDIAAYERDELLYGAIFRIKELAKLYDA